eukprot:COSAG02_NODE_2770_length_8061_cov_7.055639_8_plen_101_part_00
MLWRRALKRRCTPGYSAQLRRVANGTVLKVPAGEGDTRTRESGERLPLRLLLVDANPLVWRAVADHPGQTLRRFADIFQTCVATSIVLGLVYQRCGVGAY